MSPGGALSPRHFPTVGNSPIFTLNLLFWKKSSLKIKTAHLAKNALMKLWQQNPMGYPLNNSHKPTPRRRETWGNSVDTAGAPDGAIVFSCARPWACQAGYRRRSGSAGAARRPSGPRYRGNGAMFGREIKTE